MSTPVAERLDLTQLERRSSRRREADIHPYFGRVDPALAATLIENYSVPGATVLDPFCGSGTVLAESLLAERSALGWDSSPLAAGISIVRLSSPKDIELEELEELAKELVPWSSTAAKQVELPNDRVIPAMPRVRSISMWFGEWALAELGFLRAWLLQRETQLSPIARLLAWVAFSRIITGASNQEGESNYRCVEKDHPRGHVVTMFCAALTAVGRAAQASLPGVGTRQMVDLSPTAGTIGWSDRSATVVVRDSRLGAVGRQRADLVVTSPPYLMSWDYGLYHKFRFYWLGLDLDVYEQTEIGRHLRRKRDDVERYRQDMTATFEVLDTVLRKGGHIAIINSPSIVYGRQVDTNKILGECAAEVGWRLESCQASLDLTGPHHGMYGSLVSRRARAPGAPGKQEHVLIFSQAGG
jgi:DNA methylase